MIDGQCYAATVPTEAEARLWELETRAAEIRRRGAASVTFADYATDWLAGFIEHTPDRASFEAALEHVLLPVLGQFPLIEVLEADRNELHRQLPDTGRGGDDGATRECLHLILADAAEDLRAGALAADAQVRQGRPATRLRE
jgi:hypothetical protein